KYPGVKFIGLCHEIASLHEHLPKMLNMPWEQIDVTASGLNHFSVLLEAKEKETGRDLYPQIREEAQRYFQKVPSWLPEMLQEAGKKSERTIRPWHERGLFKTILDNYGLLPITTDSHFGEYPAWAYSVVDHKGILDFYNTYKTYVTLSTPKIDLECHERVVPIMDGILTDAGFIEGAVNIPNDGLIDDFPSFVAVEVPAKIDSSGVTGIPTGHLMPPGLMGLFYNQVAIHRLTAETVLTGSKEMALQALLSDPMITEVDKTIEMLDQMLEIQQKYLGYIK
ncbi:MAG: alpha-glucosidase, partial [Calditrichota bacterium]